MKCVGLPPGSRYQNWKFQAEPGVIGFGLPVGELKNYTAFKDRMLQRPAVRRIVEDEKVKI